MQVSLHGSELVDLADFQKLATQALTDAQVRSLLRHPRFFVSPKNTDQAYRQHARSVDKILGFAVQDLENHLVLQARSVLPNGSFEYWGPALHEGAQTWVGLDPQTLNTPYGVLKRICDVLKLRAGELVVDLGAALGRLGVVMHQCAPRAHFLGLEYVGERVDEAQRIYRKWGMENARCEVQDLFAQEFSLPEADVFFIYDYGRHDHINATLAQIQVLAKSKRVRVVARGQATNRLISLHHAWLEESFSGTEVENFKIYHPEAMS